jgi:phosphoribosyl 1,2-cyclic phosphate phosphodiesterase
MQITLLGTGTSSGVPQIGCNCAVCRSLDYRDKRLRTSAHVAVEGKSIVIDTGPDFRQQMLRLGLRHLDAVLFTHEHKDHTAGLDDVRAFNFLQQKAIPVYGRNRVIDQLQREFSYVFAEQKYPGVPHIEVQEIENQLLDVVGVSVLPIDVLHHRLPVFGYRIGDFTYLTDLNFISDAEIDKVRGTEVLVLDALQRTPHISHFTLDEAVAVVEKIRPRMTFFTHISHRLGLHRDLEKELPPYIRPGYDGQRIIL